MLVRKIKYENGREIYRKTNILDKIKYYEDLIKKKKNGLELNAILLLPPSSFISFLL